MNQPSPPPGYSQQDLLLLLGQCTVELAVLRSQIAQLQAQLAAERSQNGVAEEAHAHSK